MQTAGSDDGGVQTARELGRAFGPEEIAIISTAYQAMLADLCLSDQEDAVTLLVARRVIELASEGELDPDRLRSATLAFVGNNGLDELGGPRARSHGADFAGGTKGRRQSGSEWFYGSDLHAGNVSALAENGSRNVYSRTNRNSGVAIQFRNEIVPLAIMSWLSAAIVVVFAVTVMH
jgi:hypothetical protein